MVLFGLGSMVRLDTTGAPATGTSPVPVPVPVLEPLPPTELPTVVGPALMLVPPVAVAAVWTAVPVDPAGAPLLTELAVVAMLPMPPAVTPVVVAAESCCACEASARSPPAHPPANTAMHAHHVVQDTEVLPMPRP